MSPRPQRSPGRRGAGAQGFWHLSSLAAPPPPAEFSDDRLKALTSRVWGGQTYDELDAIGGMVIGAPDQIAAKVEHLEAIGVDTLLLVASFGNLSHAQVSARSSSRRCRDPSPAGAHARGGVPARDARIHRVEPPP